ncbi:MAG: hypothetical protein PVSMB7_02210 [Chloroflexota bacterium]
MVRTAVPLGQRALQAPPLRYPFTSRRVSMLAAAALTSMMALYGSVFLWLSLRSYWAYEMHALDMGNMGQAAWNTIHGHPFFFTNMRLPYNIEAWKTTTRLSFHVEAIFPLISLVYLVYPHPESLLVLQTLALAAGAIPVYLLARDRLESIPLALAFVLSYLLFPTVQAMNLYEFHPVALATPLLLYAFLFATREQYRAFGVCCLLAMGTKEEIGLIVGLLGAFVAIVQKERRVGWSIAGLGVFWSLFAAFVVEHHYRQPGSVTYLHTRYQYLGHGIRGVFSTVLGHPGVVIETVFTWTKFGYLVRLFAPAGFLSLADPAPLLLGLPTWALNLLSTEPHMYSALGQNSAELIPLIMISAIWGAERALTGLCIAVAQSRARMILFSYIVLSSLWTQHVYGFGPGSANFAIPDIGAHQHTADRFVAMIPNTAPVATQDQLDPHLSSRHYLYLFEDNGHLTTRPFLPLSQYILLDASAPTYPLPSSTLRDRALPYIARRGWGVAAADDGLLLIAKGATRRVIPQRFYAFLRPQGTRPDHALRMHTNGLTVLGYTSRLTDRFNEHPARVAYSIYLRPSGPMRHNLQFLAFAVTGGQVIQCSMDDLGLAWLPTSRWKPHQEYVVHVAPLQLSPDTLGTVRVYLGLGRSDPAGQSTCASAWAQRLAAWRAGTVDVGL